jgi:hypothetical protein
MTATVAMAVAAQAKSVAGASAILSVPRWAMVARNARYSSSRVLSTCGSAAS